MENNKTELNMDIESRIYRMGKTIGNSLNPILKILEKKSSIQCNIYPDIYCGQLLWFIEAKFCC